MFFQNVNLSHTYDQNPPKNLFKHEINQILRKFHKHDSNFVKSHVKLHTRNFINIKISLVIFGIYFHF